MEEITCKTKKWGGSIGIVIPKEVVEKERIKPDEDIKIAIRRIPLAKEIWGLAPRKKFKSTQEIKNWMREQW